METTTKLAAELLEERRGAVLWLTINREERRNAMSPAVLAGMAEALDAAPSTDRDVRAIVITGAGTRPSAPAPTCRAARRSPADYSEPYGHFAQLLRQAQASNVPLIARVNGACMAGGMGLLAMCDLAVAGPPRDLRPARSQGRRVPGPGAERAAAPAAAPHAGRDVPHRRTAHLRAGAASTAW